MTKNPLYNAVAALTYIVFIVSVIRLVGLVAGDTPDNEFLAPIGALSLLVLSAAIMTYVFFYSPVLLLFEHKEKVAITLFLKTVAYFAGLTLVVFSAMLLLL